MLLDDHDLRDDWNTSKSWRDWITQQPWWRDRVTGAYGSYWVYQHLGNLSPDELATEPLYEAMRTLDDDDRRTERLDDVRVERRRRRHHRPVQLPARARQPRPGCPSGGDRLALLAPPRSRRPADGRPGRVGVDPRRRAAARRRRRRAPGAGVDAAVPDAAGRPPHGGLERGGCPGGVGTAGQAVRRVVPAVPRSRTLGGVPRVVRRVHGSARRGRDRVRPRRPPC